MKGPAVYNNNLVIQKSSGVEIAQVPGRSLCLRTLWGVVKSRTPRKTQLCAASGETIKHFHFRVSDTPEATIPLILQLC